MERKSTKDIAQTGRSEAPVGGGATPGANPANERLWLRVVWMAAALLAFVSPLVVPALFFLVAPRAFSYLCAAYTGIYYPAALDSADWSFWGFLRREWLQFYRLYMSRASIELLVRGYNFIPHALALGLVASLAALLLSRRLARRRRRGIETLVLAPIVLFVALFLRAPYSLALTVACCATYAVNFPLAFAERDPAKPLWQRARILAAAIALPPILHLFAPTLLFAAIMRAVAPRSDKAARWALRAGRWAVVCFSFPVLAFVFFSFGQIPLSDGVERLLAERGLYDVELDRVGRRILVTDKEIGRILLLDWDSPASGPVRVFRVESSECEDIALDEKRREIFHAARNVSTVFVIDADTFATRRKRAVPFATHGSTNIVVVPDAKRVFVSNENGGVYAVDQDSLDLVQTIARYGKSMSYADDARGLVYVQFYGIDRIAVFDAATCRFVTDVRTPRCGDRIAVAPRRGVLYAPDAFVGRAWVFRLPELLLVKKIPAPRGVRAMAVDETRNLLLAASFLSGYVSVIDLASDREIERFYVGPYCRVMKVDAENRRAFLTTRQGGLYMIRY